MSVPADRSDPRELTTAREIAVSVLAFPLALLLWLVYKAVNAWPEGRKG